VTTTPPDGAPPPAPSAREVRKVALASLVGTSIEWYDFYIYGLAAVTVFAPQFFPNVSSLTGTLAAFATFAVGFIARPIGGVVFGHLGDRIGRKNTLVTTLVTMGVATTLIGVLPTYATIGALAPVLLVVLRLVQGFAVGGEWGGAVLISVEHAPESKRGFYGSFPQLGVPLGLVASNALFLVLAAALPAGAFGTWGWRIPFLLSALLVGVGLYVRLQIEESSEFVAVKRTGSMALPIASVLRHHFPQVLAGVAIFTGITGIGYMAATYSIQYGTSSLGLPRAALIAIVLVVAVLEVPIILWFSAKSDRWGHSRTIVAGSVATAIVAALFLPALASGSLVLIALAVAGARWASAPMWGPSGALAAECYPVEVRYSGASVGYQFGSIVGGALAPIITTLLLASPAGIVGASAYLVIITVLTGVGAVVAARIARRSAPTAGVAV
jgi:MFS family permease